MSPNYDTFMSKDHAREWKRLNLPDEASSTSSSEEEVMQETRKPIKPQLQMQMEDSYSDDEDDDSYTDDDEDGEMGGEDDEDQEGKMRKQFNEDDNQTQFKQTAMKLTGQLESKFDKGGAEEMMNTRAAVNEDQTDRADTIADQANVTKTTLPPMLAEEEQQMQEEEQQHADVKNKTMRKTAGLGKLNRT